MVAPALGCVLCVGPVLGQAAAPAASFDSVAASAQAAMNADHVPEAINLYTQATRLKPEWTEGWWHLGTLLFDSGRFPEAHDAFVRFVTVEQKEPGPGFAMLGLTDFQLKRYSEALKALESGIRFGVGTSPEFNHTVLYHDGILQARFGEPEIALQRLTLAANELASLQPQSAQQSVLGDSDLVKALGIAALRMQVLPSEVPAADQEVVGLAGHAQALIALQERVQAERDLKELLVLYPSYPGVHYMYGVFLEKEHPPLAADEFHREIEVDPKNAVARIQLAFQMLTTGEYQQGLKYAQEATLLAPRNFIGHVACGRLLLELGKTQRAVQELRTAARLAPSSPDAHLALSRAYDQAGLKSQAARERAEFERIKAIEDRTRR